MESNTESKTEIIDQSVKTPEASLVSIDANLNDRFVENAEKQINLRSKLLMTALKAMKPHDIQDFEGKPYIEGEGAARIMAVIRGFKVGEAKFNVEIINPHYFVDCSIPMEFMGATTVAIGDCSTADSFFTGKEGDGGRYGKYTKQTGSETMASRLLLGDAKKKARENAISRGVSELLGLKGLNWDDLKDLGFDRSKSGSSVSFKQGSQGGSLVTMTLTQAVEVGVGSKFNTKGFVTEVKEKTVKDKKITKYTITDNKKSVDIQAWGSSIDGIVIGESQVFFQEVIVSEYNGSKQYTAKEVRLIESEASNGNDK